MVVDLSWWRRLVAVAVVGFLALGSPGCAPMAIPLTETERTTLEGKWGPLGVALGAHQEEIVREVAAVLGGAVNSVSLGANGSVIAMVPSAATEAIAAGARKALEGAGKASSLPEILTAMGSALAVGVSGYFAARKRFTGRLLTMPTSVEKELIADVKAEVANPGENTDDPEASAPSAVAMTIPSLSKELPGSS